MISPMMRISIDNVDALFVQGNYSANVSRFETHTVSGVSTMFPGTYVPRYRYSPNLCSPVPMFPGTYVPRFTAHLLDVVIGIGIQSEHFEEKNNSGLYSVGAYTCMRVCDGAHVCVCAGVHACVRACV